MKVVKGLEISKTPRDPLKETKQINGAEGALISEPKRKQRAATNTKRR